MPHNTNSKDCIRNNLIDIVNNDGKGNKSKCGRKAAIVELSPQAQIVYAMSKNGVGSPQIAATINEWRKKRNLDIIGKDAVDRFIKRSSILKRFRRLSEKDRKSTRLNSSH